MTSSSPRPFPAVLAALAGFVLAAGAGARCAEGGDASPPQAGAAERPARHGTRLGRAARVATQARRGARTRPPCRHACENSLARLEGYLLAHPRADIGRP